MQLHCSLLLLLPLLSLPPITFACNSDEFYTPKTCLLAGVVSTFECKKCPANAVQYAAADELCVCKQGYFATGARKMCDSYVGNSGGPPPFEDGFTCTECSGANMCLGGALEVPVTSSLYWTGNGPAASDDFYVQCETSSTCKSGFVRVPSANGMYLWGVAWKLRHAPRRQCPIFGQSFVGDECTCPENSEVAYSLARKPGSPDAILATTFAGYSDVWNYNVMPQFLPPWPPIFTTDLMPKYFGR